MTHKKKNPPHLSLLFFTHLSAYSARIVSNPLNLMKSIKKWIKKLKLQKMHLDYLVGILSIPVLVTAIILNWGNLHKTDTPQASPTPTPQVLIISPATKAPTTNPVPSPSGVCQKQIGPVDISYPQEGQTVSDNPLCITINYPDSSYCSVVWSYRINNGSWSDYNTNAPCLYNLPNGSSQFQLRVQSTASQDTKTLVRNFSYQGANNSPSPTPSSTPSPTASSSATIN